jgi:hypothetical protein
MGLWVDPENDDDVNEVVVLGELDAELLELVVILDIVFVIDVYVDVICDVAMITMTEIAIIIGIDIRRIYFAVLRATLLGVGFLLYGEIKADQLINETAYER